MNELFLFYTLAILVLILSWVLIVLIQYLFNVLKKNNLYQKDIERIEKDILSHNQQLIDRAREKAYEIITTANTRAQEIIMQTNKLEEETTQNSKQIADKLLKSQKEELERARDQLFNQYKTLLEELYQDNVNLFKSISKDIEDKAGLEIKDFKEILEKETLESQRIVGQKIETRYNEVERELEDYRNNELQKLEDNIYKITKTAVELAVGRSLDQETHQDLVMDALKEAIEKGEVKTQG